MPAIEVLNSSVEDVSSIEVLIYVVGYEARSSYIARRYAARSNVVIGYFFEDGHFLSFSDNASFFKEVNGIRLDHSAPVADVLRNQGIRELRGKNVVVDVSSFNRSAMSSVIGNLLDDDLFQGANIYIAYALAKYVPPSEEDVDFLDFGPIRGFGGWTSRPELPVVLVMGLGYERDHAMGALEFLDPSGTYCFSPRGLVDSFRFQVEAENETLFQIIGKNRVFSYSVPHPYQTYWELRSLLLSLLPQARIVMVPMGPKIFSSLTFVMQRMLGDEVSVWRASGHTLESARDATAAGAIISYLVRRQGD